MVERTVDYVTRAERDTAIAFAEGIDPDQNGNPRKARETMIHEDITAQAVLDSEGNVITPTQRRLTFDVVPKVVDPVRVRKRVLRGKAESGTLSNPEIQEVLDLLLKGEL